jgi:hypothetical protein
LVAGADGLVFRHFLDVEVTLRPTRPVRFFSPLSLEKTPPPVRPSKLESDPN